jgi:hypothetical protein
MNLVQINDDRESWTAKLSCQIFVQKLIERLNLNYSSNVLTWEDLPPTIFYLSVHLQIAQINLKKKMMTMAINSKLNDKLEDICRFFLVYISVFFSRQNFFHQINFLIFIRFLVLLKKKKYNELIEITVLPLKEK